MTRRRYRGRDSDDDTSDPEYDALQVMIQKTVHDEIRAFGTLSKNGDSWGGWMLRIATPERIFWLMCAIFVLGGRVRDYESGQQGLQGQAEKLSAVYAAVEKDVRTLQAQIIEQSQFLKAQETQLNNVNTAAATKADIARVEAQVRVSITRREFQATLRQQILPRLDRIEKRLPAQ